MLKKFFELNSPITIFETPERLIEHFDTSDHLRNVLYEPSELDLPRPKNVFRKLRFTNVSFAKTEIRNVEFRNCIFEDCLFTGTKFINCEFHRCTFQGCNPHKIVFENTYIDPKVFEGMLDPKKYSNIGIHLFQQLFTNAENTHQRDFAHTAEFNFNKWKRYHLNYERRTKRLSFWAYVQEWLPNLLYYSIAGYGIRTKFFASWTASALIILFLVNFTLWDRFEISQGDGNIANGGIIDVFYFSVITMATVGFGDLTPSSSLGRFAVACEAIIGLILLSVFATILIKRLVR